jgi:hypothetical protein
VIRELGNSPVTPFLGGGTAVLLQVAHPLVAAGVADHSAFEDDLWRRLLGRSALSTPSRSEARQRPTAPERSCKLCTPESEARPHPISGHSRQERHTPPPIRA